jgi:hypothetical protein
VNGPLVEQAQRLHPGGIEMEQRQRDADHRDGAQDEAWLLRFGRRDLGIRHHQSSPSVSSMRTRSRGAASDRDTTVPPALIR